MKPLAKSALSLALAIVGGIAAGMRCDASEWGENSSQTNPRPAAYTVKAYTEGSDPFIPLVRGTECFVGALVTPPPVSVAEAVRSRRGELGPAIYVGPEGDFSPEELQALLEIATPVSFGSTILRAETAAIYGVSALKSQLDEML